MMQSFVDFILFRLIFVQDTILQEVLDDRHEGCLAFLVQGHYCVYVVFLVGSFGQDCDDQLEHLEDLLDIVIFGNFDKINILGLDPFLNLFLKILLNQDNQFLKIGQPMRPLTTIFHKIAILDFKIRCRFE